jgi:hypothetical protein
VRVLVCGSRDWVDAAAIRARLSKLPNDTVIVHGAAPGADSLAGREAVKLGFVVEAYPAAWGLYGRAAGPIRNRQMLDTSPDLVIAFHYDIASSHGTRDCVLEAKRRGIAVEILP